MPKGEGAAGELAGVLEVLASRSLLERVSSVRLGELELKFGEKDEQIDREDLLKAYEQTQFAASGG